MLWRGGSRNNFTAKCVHFVSKAVVVHQPQVVFSISITLGMLHSTHWNWKFARCELLIFIRTTLILMLMMCHITWVKMNRSPKLLRSPLMHVLCCADGSLCLF